MRVCVFIERAKKTRNLCPSQVTSHTHTYTPTSFVLPHTRLKYPCLRFSTHTHTVLTHKHTGSRAPVVHAVCVAVGQAVHELLREPARHRLRQPPAALRQPLLEVAAVGVLQSQVQAQVAAGNANLGRGGRWAGVEGEGGVRSLWGRDIEENRHTGAQTRPPPAPPPPRPAGGPPLPFPLPPSQRPRFWVSNALGLELTPSLPCTATALSTPAPPPTPLPPPSRPPPAPPPAPLSPPPAVPHLPEADDVLVLQPALAHHLALQVLQRAQVALHQRLEDLQAQAQRQGQGGG